MMQVNETNSIKVHICFDNQVNNTGGIPQYYFFNNDTDWY